MDWSKVKTILIIALALTNVFLLSTLDLSKQTSEEVEDETALFAILEKRGISIETQIPKSHEDMGALAVRYADIDETLIRTETEAISLSGRNEISETAYINAADGLLKKLGLDCEDASCEVEVLNENLAEVHYCIVVDGISLDGCYIDVCFENGRVSDFKYKWLIPISVSGKSPTVSAAVALMRFMAETEGEAAENISVSGIEPVYWLSDNGDSDNVVSDTAFAYWKITYNDGLVKHIIAYE